MIQLDRHRVVSFLIFLVGLFFAFNFKMITRASVGDASSASDALIALFGIMLTTQSLLFVIASGHNPRWPGLGRVIRYSWFYVAISLAATSTLFTFLSHFMSNPAWLHVGTVLWAITVMVGALSLYELLQLNTRKGKNTRLKKILFQALKHQSKAEDVFEISLEDPTFSDFASALEASVEQSGGGEMLDLVAQLQFSKDKIAAYPSYLALETESVRTILRAVIAGTLKPGVAGSSLTNLLVNTSATKEPLLDLNRDVSLALFELASTVEYLNWLENAVISEGEHESLNIPSLRRVLALISGLREDLTTEREFGKSKKVLTGHTNPANSIDTFYEALLFFAMVGNYGSAAASYSHYVFYEAVTGLRFNGDYFNGRPIIFELIEIAYNDGSQPANVERYVQSEDLTPGLRQAFATRQDFEDALMQIFVARVATLAGRVIAEQNAGLPPDLSLKISRVQSIIRGAASMLNISDSFEAGDVIARSLVIQDNEWGRLVAGANRIGEHLLPLKYVDISDRLAALLLIVIARFQSTIGSESTPVIEFVASLDTAVQEQFYVFLTDLTPGLQIEEVLTADASHKMAAKIVAIVRGLIF